MGFLSFLVGFALFIWIGSQFYDKSDYEISNNAYNEPFDDEASKTEVLSNQLMSAEQKKAHLKSDYWHNLKRLRNEYIADGRCECCFTKTDKLEAHHLTYERLGFEEVKDIALLCRVCHQNQHDYYGYDRLTDYSKLIR